MKALIFIFFVIFIILIIHFNINKKHEIIWQKSVPYYVQTQLEDNGYKMNPDGSFSLNTEQATKFYNNEIVFTTGSIYRFKNE